MCVECIESCRLSSLSGIDMFIPYQVSVMPRNPAGCGVELIMPCFTLEGCKFHTFSFHSPSRPSTHPPPPHPAPVRAPSNVMINRSTDDASRIVVKWQPLTLVEARGFVMYRVDLRVANARKRQADLSMTALWNESNVTFTGLNPSSSYEGTVTAVPMDGTERSK